MQQQLYKVHTEEVLGPYSLFLSDLYKATDQSEVTLVALFDVSAAFDIVDPDILLEQQFPNLILNCIPKQMK